MTKKKTQKLSLTDLSNFHLVAEERPEQVISSDVKPVEQTKNHLDKYFGLGEEAGWLCRRDYYGKLTQVVSFDSNADHLYVKNFGFRGEYKLSSVEDLKKPPFTDCEVVVRQNIYCLNNEQKTYISRHDRVKVKSGDRYDEYLLTGKDEYTVKYNYLVRNQFDLDLHRMQYKFASAEQCLAKKSELEAKVFVIEYDNVIETVSFGGGGDDYNPAFERGWMGRDSDW